MDKKKKIVGVLITLTIIFTVMGSTFAYLSWSSSKEQKTQVTFTKEAGFSCSVNGGGNIAEGDVILMPTVVNDSTTSYYIKRTITVKPTITDSLLPVYMDLWLDINSLGTGLSNSLNFKYALTTSSTSPTTGVVSSGNFNGKITGDKINLLTSKKYTATTTDTYYLWIWLDAEETSSDTMNQSFSLSLGGNCYNKMPITATTLINNANPSTLMYADATDSQKAEMWTFSHEATEQLEATTDYRYIGSSPNNYITYNDEVWRIIGVFDGRIKIIKDTSIGSMRWDVKDIGVGSSTSDYGSNDWTDSQLMYMLNPTSYTLKAGYSLSDNLIYDGSGNKIYQLGCRPTYITSESSSYSCTNNTWSLNTKALSQISETTYYLGGNSTTSATASDAYILERGTTVYSGRPTSWNGLVGLMYPSDYGYTFANGVDDTCYTNISLCNNGIPNSSWLYKSDRQWMITPTSINSSAVAYVDSSGAVVGYYVGGGNLHVFPVVYLNLYTKLEGDVTSSNPYEIIE